MKLASFILLYFCSGSSLNCAQNTPQINDSLLHKYFTATGHAVTYRLSKKLNEISGLATAPDGRIFAHNDEFSTIYQIDINSGEILKSFTMGEKKKNEDFEGIAIKGDLFYLVTSEGNIFKFREGKDDEHVTFEKYKTFLSSRNDVEGLCYDPVTDALLLACKGYPGKGFKNKKAVYSFSLRRMSMEREPFFLIDEEELARQDNHTFLRKLGDFFLLPTEVKFEPSGIEYNTLRDSFFIISAVGNAIIELSREGKILGKVNLDPDIHRQPEGITFSADHSLLISNEGAGRSAMLFLYKLK